MKIIKPGMLPSIIKIPTSKSYANRALILAALKPSSVFLENMPKADDVVFLINCLKKIGLEIVETHENIEIKNSFPECEDLTEDILEVGEGGTTARFLACMLLLGQKRYKLKLGTRLKERPWDDFLELGCRLGARVDLNDDILEIQGPITVPEELVIDCSKTTQFASGMQLAFAFKKCQVTPEKLESSLSYWTMTQKLIDTFHKNRIYKIPLDWSSASYPLAFAALKQSISFPGLVDDPFQADSKFLTILKDFGCVEEDDNGIKIHPINDLEKDITFDVSDCLDLVPTLGFFLAHINGTHRLINLKNLIHKESDRLHEVCKLLKNFGYQVAQSDNDIVIEGCYSLPSKEVTLEMPDDHRMVMSAALFMRFHQGGMLTPEKAVNKSYPDFFKLF